MTTIREAIAGDEDALAELWGRYLAEHYRIERGPSAEVVLRDGIAETRRVRFVVAIDDHGRMRGAAAWSSGYDLHHFVRGVDVLDLYVAPPHRGRGLAVQLMAHIARAGAAEGAEYMRGGASLEPTPGRRLYDRCVVYFEGKTANLSARAFRHLASLADASPREICRSLPQRAWNFEP